MADAEQKKRSKDKKPGRIVLFFTNFTLNKKTKRRLLLTFIIGLVFVALSILTDNIEILWVVFLVPGMVLTIYPIGIILVINENNSSKTLFAIIAFVFVGLLFKTMHWPGAGIILTLSLLTLGCGYFFLAFKNFFSIKDNTYLRIVSTLAALFISLMSTGMVFKMMHWPGAGILLAMSLVPSMIFTMLVLITLPGSDYIKWRSNDKKMFSRTLLIPWMFFLLVSAFAFLLPKNFISEELFSKKATTPQSTQFNMEPYEIKDAEGLEPGQ